jgi:hypothetical protein
MTKRCRYCKQLLSVELFSNNKKEKDGLNRQCKPCQRVYYQKNRAAIIARVQANTDKQEKQAYDLKRRKEKSDQIKEYDRARNALPHRIQANKEWQKANPEARRITAAKYMQKRRASQLKATPSWFGELDEFALQEALKLCQLREKTTNLKWELDHVVPLLGKTVCGLHCWANFQVVPMQFNRKKSNKFPHITWVNAA